MERQKYFFKKHDFGRFCQKIGIQGSFSGLISQVGSHLADFRQISLQKEPLFPTVKRLNSRWYIQIFNETEEVQFSLKVKKNNGKTPKNV